MGMTREEIIADERYHTCGRCRWGDLNEDSYPCKKCIHSMDKREDFWQYAEEVEEGIFDTEPMEFNVEFDQDSIDQFYELPPPNGSGF